MEVLNRFGITVADLIVMLTATCGGIVGIVTSIISFRTSAKWNQKQIDAELKSKARLEWIQGVRAATAELLSAYYKILRVKEINEIAENLVDIKKKSDLLALYFGPETETIVSDNFEILIHKTSNKGKNDYIVKYLRSLYTSVYRLCYSIKINEETYESAVSKLKEGEKMPLKRENEYKEIVENCEIRQIFRSKQKDEIIEQLEMLMEYIRIYLKIEWDIAKKGL